MDTFPYEGLTFDDVSLITQYADFLPTDTSISSKLTRNIDLKIPLFCIKLTHFITGSLM